MNKLSDSYTLSNGVSVPCVGFGTWKMADGEETASAVKEAITMGYRHIDTATIYKNEESVGRGIFNSGVDRNELFVTTKLWNDDHGYDLALRAFEASLAKLGLSTLDLYLIHWPNPEKLRDNWEESNAETWRAMEDLYRAGKIRAIGVSNFMPHHLEALMKTANIAPMVNQIRLFPGFMWAETVTYCQQKNICIEAYSPLGKGVVLASPIVVEIAEKYGKTPAQVCVRWSLQMGFLPLPKTVTPERIRENAQIFDFSLSASEMTQLTRMENLCGDGKHPDEAPF